MIILIQVTNIDGKGDCNINNVGSSDNRKLTL